MKIKHINFYSFLAFTAVFAVLASVVFWGTWSIDIVPIMPDCSTSFSVDRAGDFIATWWQTGKFVPGDIIAFLGDPYFWVELQYVLALYFAGLGMAYFLRGHGVNHFAAYSSGLLLAFSGYWCTLFSAGHLGWFQWMTYGTFAFGLIDRMLKKGKLRHCVLLGAVLAWGSFYQPDLWLLFTIFTFFYFVFRSIVCWPGLQTWLIRVAIAFGVFVIIGLPSFKSAIGNDLAGRDKQIEESSQSAQDCKLSEAEKRWVFITNWSMPPEAVNEFIIPGVQGDTSCPITQTLSKDNGNDVSLYTGRLGRPIDYTTGHEAKEGSYRQHSLYIGFLTCFLAFYALIHAIVVRDRHLLTVLFLFALGALFLVFSMGRYIECVYRVIYNIPLLGSMRCPVKWLHLTEFCLVALAGFGLNYLWNLKFASSKSLTIGCRSVLVIAVFVGALNLACEAKLYCAPHKADTVVAPFPNIIPKDANGAIQLPGATPRDPELAKKAYEEQFKKILYENGLRVVGSYDHTQKLTNGQSQVFDVLLVEQKIKKPAPKVVDKSTNISWIAVASALATVLSVIFLIVCICNPKVNNYIVKRKSGISDE